MTRVAVFVDYQNVYKGARETFGASRFTDGQIHPHMLGGMLTDLGHPVDPTRQLEYVKVFRGEPSAMHSKTSHAACHRQMTCWEAHTVIQAISRPLKYYRRGSTPDGKPIYEPREKGIDVLIALHLVMGAMQDEYDVAVLMSGDADLAPALETVLDLGKRCEVAAWQNRRRNRTRLATQTRNIWCHWLDRHAYQLVSDPTDYTKPQPDGVSKPVAGLFAGGEAVADRDEELMAGFGER